MMTVFKEEKKSFEDDYLKMNLIVFFNILILNSRYSDQNLNRKL